MKRVDLEIFFRDKELIKNSNLFFFTYEEFFLVKRAIEKISEVRNIKKKKVLVGKEFNLKEISETEKEGSLFGKEKHFFIIYSSEDAKFRNDFLTFSPEIPFVFIFNDPKFPDKNKILYSHQKAIRVHFPKVDEKTAIIWLKRELQKINKIYPSAKIVSIVRENENSLLRLNNTINILKLGGEFTESLKEEKETDVQEMINKIIYLMRKGTIDPKLIWKLYEPLLYNRRVNYDYKKEIKMFLRRYHERRFKY